MRALSSQIANYLETGQYEKQLSPDTIKAYRIDLQQFSDFTKGVWADKDMLEQYIKHLNQHFAPRSFKRKLASIRAFYHEQIVQALLQSTYDAYTQGHREPLICSDIHLPLHFWKQGWTYDTFSLCWGIVPSPPRKSTHMYLLGSRPFCWPRSIHGVE